MFPLGEEDVVAWGLPFANKSDAMARLDEYLDSSTMMDTDILLPAMNWLRLIATTANAPVVVVGVRTADSGIPNTFKGPSVLVAVYDGQTTGPSPGAGGHFYTVFATLRSRREEDGRGGASTAGGSVANVYIIDSVPPPSDAADAHALKLRRKKTVNNWFKDLATLVTVEHIQSTEQADGVSCGAAMVAMMFSIIDKGSHLIHLPDDEVQGRLIELAQTAHLAPQMDWLPETVQRAVDQIDVVGIAGESVKASRKAAASRAPRDSKAQRGGAGGRGRGRGRGRGGGRGRGRSTGPDSPNSDVLKIATAEGDGCASPYILWRAIIVTITWAGLRIGPGWALYPHASAEACALGWDAFLRLARWKGCGRPTRLLTEGPKQDGVPWDFKDSPCEYVIPLTTLQSKISTMMLRKRTTMMLRRTASG